MSVLSQLNWGGGGCPFLSGQYSIVPKLALWPLWQSWSPHMWRLARSVLRGLDPGSDWGRMGRKGKASKAQGERERERTLLSCLPLQSPEPAPQPPHKQPFATASRLASSTRGWPCPRPLSRAAPRREQTRCVETEDPEVLASETSKLGQAVCLSGSFCFFLCEMK